MLLACPRERGAPALQSTSGPSSGAAPTDQCLFGVWAPELDAVPQMGSRDNRGRES